LEQFLAIIRKLSYNARCRWIEARCCERPKKRPRQGLVGLNVTLKPTKDGIAKKTGVDLVAGATSA
jgi:hypothetical protein